MLKVIDGPGLRLLASARHGDIGLAIAFDGACSTIWRVSADPPHLERVAELPGLLHGGAWLDRAGTLLGVDRAKDSGPAKALAIDLEDGSWTPLLNISTTSNDRLLCSPRSGLLLVSTDASGRERLGWGRLGGREPVRFPESLHRLDPAAVESPGGVSPPGAPGTGHKPLSLSGSRHPALYGGANRQWTNRS
ncbi:MAG: hypothetical protein ACRDZ4_09130, partial [Egibacteraceae bacterium]